jgi:hypothetical protein
VVNAIRLDAANAAAGQLDAQIRSETTDREQAFRRAEAW